MLNESLMYQALPFQEPCAEAVKIVPPMSVNRTEEQLVDMPVPQCQVDSVEVCDGRQSFRHVCHLFCVVLFLRECSDWQPSADWSSSDQTRERSGWRSSGSWQSPFSWQ